MASSEFDRNCKERGFRRSKSIYARCIGDGILQTISIRGRTYVSPDSPYYSKNKRKSNYISVGLWSMYCPLPEVLFDPESSIIGRFKVENFRGRKFLHFKGIEDDHIFMIEKGLSVLDSIQTQEKLIDITQFLYTAELGGVGPVGIELVEPYLKCGCYTEALDRAGSYYASQWAMFHEAADEMPIEEYQINEKRIRMNTHDISVLWSMIARKDYDRIEKYLKDNFEKNIGYAKKYGIPLNLSVSPEIYSG